MPVLFCPQMIMVAGTGRKSGKTTLACNIIERFSAHVAITAVKISKLHHPVDKNSMIWVEEEGFCVMEEMQQDAGKDSSRMLASGAARSFFIMAHDSRLTQVMPFIRQQVGDGLLVVESGALRKFVEPGIFFIVNRSGNHEIKAGTKEFMEKEHRLITLFGSGLDFDISRLGIINNLWIIQEP